jgi:hypothetical protein
MAADEDFFGLYFEVDPEDANRACDVTMVYYIIAYQIAAAGHSGCIQFRSSRWVPQTE